MRSWGFWLVIAGLIGGVFFITAGKTHAQTTIAFAGSVASQEEGLMEGVLVGAKRENSTMTIYVVSDEKGRYSFPRAKLLAGRYSLRIKAVGYELANAGNVEITDGKTTQRDLKLRKTEDLAAQLSNTEW